MRRASELGERRVGARGVGLVAGPLVAVLAYRLLPEAYVAGSGEVTAFSEAGRATLGLMLWMAVWWMTEAVAIEATSLLPVVVLPLCGVQSISEAAAPYGSPLIFLFLGGFLLALSMQRWGLDRRIALFTLRLAGTRPTHMIGGFMVATAVMSACVSNTATVAVMVPIAIGVARFVGEDGGAFRSSLLLSIAYAASIGGLATIIGSPPNGFVVQYASEELGLEITFLDWLRLGLPLALLFLPLAWLLLTRVVFRVSSTPIAGVGDLVRAQSHGLGPVNAGERATLWVFVLAVAGWVARPVVAEVLPGLTDAGVAISAGLLLFVLPLGRSGERALDWSVAKDLPWGVLVLFGGGLSLAAAVGDFGVADYIGASARDLHGLAPHWTVLLVVGGMVFLTEMTSNTATAATMVPLLSALAPAMGMHPMELAVPAALAASCAFMLPVATPPNAIVFGTGLLSMRQMMRAGIWLNVAAILLLGVLCRFFLASLLP